MSLTPYWIDLKYCAPLWQGKETQSTIVDWKNKALHLDTHLPYRSNLAACDSIQYIKEYRCSIYLLLHNICISIHYTQSLS